jgi:3D-(3,5/4)-trihydroxycyclohexane-1,2-dione acylhydrolase (decyclizing)
MSTIRLTMAQALTRYLARQMTEIDGKKVPLIAGVWAIFGHSNVAALAKRSIRCETATDISRPQRTSDGACPIAFAKASFRRRMMAVTSSIGPGATNMVTAAAVAHVNRLPLLLLPGDVFASRRPDPVLQQIENFADGTVSANDCFRPVSRYFDRITRPEQIITALQRAMAVLTDPAECGPVTLALCQDVQAEAFDYPEVFFAERIWTPRRVRPSEDEVSAAIAKFRQARKPLIVAGGGVLYSGATATLKQFTEAHRIPLAETQAGKSSLPADHPLNMGAIGVNGSSAANTLAEQADVVLAVGTRLQDFTTGSWALFQNERGAIIGINTQLFDATKHCALPLVGDADVGLKMIAAGVGTYRAPDEWVRHATGSRGKWLDDAERVMAATNNIGRPSEAPRARHRNRSADRDQGWRPLVGRSGAAGEPARRGQPRAPITSERYWRSIS